MNYTPIIGLEIHIEQSTKTRMFSRTSASHFAVEPNSILDPVALGLPGALPYPNKEAIRRTVLFGLSLGCDIAEFSKFDRKHYFYPDLPKSFQTSQYDLPLCANGSYTLSDGKEIGITRIHLEEDTGKLQHKKVGDKTVSLIDFNRSSVPLMEMVTEPDFRTAGEVSEFVQDVRRIVRYLNISDADMSQGSMRLEANVSLQAEGVTDLPDYKVELKNINSFKFLIKAIEYELKRQEKALEAGEKLTQQTRGWDENKSVTFLQRSKEEAKDYRYFPEPDLPPMELSKDFVQNLKESLPELPQAKRARFEKDYTLTEHFVEVLVEDVSRAEYFEEAVQKLDGKVKPKKIADMMVNENKDEGKTVEAFVKILEKETQKTFASEEETRSVVENVIANNPDAVTDYKKGKTNVVGFLIGQVQKELQGQADPQIAAKLISQKLSQ